MKKDVSIKVILAVDFVKKDVSIKVILAVDFVKTVVSIKVILEVDFAKTVVSIKVILAVDSVKTVVSIKVILEVDFAKTVVSIKVILAVNFVKTVVSIKVILAVDFVKTVVSIKKGASMVFFREYLQGCLNKNLVAPSLGKAQLDHLERTDRKREEETPEQCKPGTSTLPALPSPSGNESAVALQDWIEVIDGPLRDISDSSSWWWDSVKQRAQESYKKWVASGPYERLSLKPPTAEDLEKGKYSRLSARTAGMMLQAMSGVVRAEMVARAITRSSVALLFRLFTMYQPGGESEKAYILQYLVSPPKAQTATELVTVLRQWERLLLRADNLHIAKPDPSLLV